ERKACGVIRPGDARLARDLAPKLRIDWREKRIARRARMNAGDLEPRGHRHGRGENIAAADHHDLVHIAGASVLARGTESDVETGRQHNAWRDETEITRQHDVGAAIERLADRMKRLAAHDDGTIERESAEVPEIGTDVPWQLSALADDVVLADGGDEHDVHGAGFCANTASASPSRRQIFHSSMTRAPIDR